MQGISIYALRPKKDLHMRITIKTPLVYISLRRTVSLRRTPPLDGHLAKADLQ